MAFQTENTPQWSPFAHGIYREVQTWDQANPRNALRGRKLLVAVSGGLDSVVLLKTLVDLRKAMKWEMAVFHAHHGKSNDLAQLAYRDQTQNFVRQLSTDFGCPFWTMTSDAQLQSEKEFRDFRRSAISKVQSEIQADLLVWAHHQDDLLETRLLRLIRGTGVQGFESMKWLDGYSWRPFLRISKQQLKKQAEEQKLSFVEDPSNQFSEPVRNWLRNEWLPLLEDKCPGALHSLGRSLEQMSQMLQESHSSQIERWPEDLWQNGVLSRSVFLTLNASEQSQCLAMYLRSLGSQNYTQNHIREIMKHLDISEGEHRFECAQMAWSMSRDRIEARPVSRS